MAPVLIAQIQTSKRSRFTSLPGQREKMMRLPVCSSVRQLAAVINFLESLED